MLVFAVQQRAPLVSHRLPSRPPQSTDRVPWAAHWLLVVLCFTPSAVYVSAPGSHLIPSCGFPLGVHILVPYACVSLSGRLRLDRCRLSSLRKGKENGVMSYTSLSLFSPLVVLPWNFCPYIFLLAVSTSGILLVLHLVPFVSLITLFISSISVPRKEVCFPRVTDLFRVRRNKRSPSPPPAIRHVKYSLLFSGQSAEFK